MRNRFRIFISAALVALMFVGCKPTENNYKKAYDAALAKREQAATEQMRPATGLLSDDGPSMRVVEGDTVYVLRERLRLQDGTRPEGEWGVAVALFKMRTNADATAENLKAEGWKDAVSVNATRERHYTLVGNAATLDSARMVANKFKETHPDYPYIGLPGAPVLIRH